MANDFDPIMPTYAPSIVELQRRQKMADMLRQQALESPQGQMVSGHYVSPSWTQYAAQLLKGYMGGQMGKEAEQGQANLAKQYAEAKQANVQNYLQSMPQERDVTSYPQKQAAEDAQAEALFQGKDVLSPEASPVMGAPATQHVVPTEADQTAWLMRGATSPDLLPAATLGSHMFQKREDRANRQQDIIAAQQARADENRKHEEFLKSMQQTALNNRQEPIVPVTMPDGSTVYQTRSEALGKKVGAKTAGGEKPLTEAQTASLAYGTRMLDADKVLGDVGTGYSSMKVNLAGSTEGIPGLNYLTNANLSENEQKVAQAQRNFINASLRKESGASISPSEFANAKQQYFPQPGDSEAVIKQKAENRARQINSFKIGAGAVGGAKFNDVVPTTSKASDIHAEADRILGL